MYKKILLLQYSSSYQVSMQAPHLMVARSPTCARAHTWDYQLCCIIASQIADSASVEVCLQTPADYSEHVLVSGSVGVCDDL